MQNPKLSIIMPAHNEEAVIAGVAEKFCSVFPTAEVIVVCNGCTDNTFAVSSALKTKYKNLVVLDFGRIFKGGAILEGFKVAKGEIVGFVDSDGAFGPEDVLKIVGGIREAGGAISSKWTGKGFDSPFSPERKFSAHIWNFFVRLFLGLKHPDTQAGCKFFKKEAVEAIDKNFAARGFAFDIELLYKIEKAGFHVNEVFCVPKETKAGVFSLKSTPKMFLDLLKVWYNSKFH